MKTRKEGDATCGKSTRVSEEAQSQMATQTPVGKSAPTSKPEGAAWTQFMCDVEQHCKDFSLRHSPCVKTHFDKAINAAVAAACAETQTIVVNTFKQQLAAERENSTRLACELSSAKRLGDIAKRLELETKLAAAVEALEDLFAMIEEGLLVRDISKDAEPDYFKRALAFTQRLVKNKAPIDAAVKEGE